MIKEKKNENSSARVPPCPTLVTIATTNHKMKRRVKRGSVSFFVLQTNYLILKCKTAPPAFRAPSWCFPPRGPDIKKRERKKKTPDNGKLLLLIIIIVTERFTVESFFLW